MSTLAPEVSCDIGTVIAPVARSAVEVRAWVVAELAAALKVAPASIDTAAPLESLGVDSLAAIGMTGGLAGWLGRDLPATLMWDHPSIDALADALADRAAPTAQPAVRPGIVDLQPHGSRPPVFFLPGRGGHPVTFAALASRLGPERPCFGLTVPGLHGERPPLTRLEDIAAAVLANIRLVQPGGPYQLAGYSFGGLLAYEIAQQITAAGETVSMLAVFDTFTRAGRRVRPRWQRLALHAWLLATRPAHHLRHVSGRMKNRGAVGAKPRAAEPAAAAPAGGAHGPAVDLHELSRVNLRAAGAYQAKPYAGSILLFRATERPRDNVFFKWDPTLGWGALAQGGVRVVDLPGSHLRLLDAAHAPAAAAALRPHLRD